jgi:catechol 2,3-dioxygenase-like lactoylglutathione lyase family enzyme
MPADRVSDLVPFVHVADIEQSIAFYELLGLELRDSYKHDGRLDWGFLANKYARIMLARADQQIDPLEQAVLFYLYVQDLNAFRSHLISKGVRAGKIVDGTPGPTREMRLTDPDGYCLMVAEVEGGSVHMDAVLDGG